MKQPEALLPLFLTEMWERFGFYAIQSLLILYLTNALDFSDSAAYLALGEYTALIYIAPLLGGLFADRILGPRLAIMVGAVFLGLGYLLLGLFGKEILYVCLTSIIVGNGLLKPNISSFLGEFYYKDDPRRDAGFTLFYIGINLGGLLALTTVGFIEEKFGYMPAFLSAAVCMVIAFITFYFCSKAYENRGLPIPRNEIKPKLLRLLSYKTSLFLLLAISFLAVFLLIRSAKIGEDIQNFFGLTILAVMLYVTYKSDSRMRKRMIALIVLILSSIVFWGLFFQVFGAISLFTERNVNRYFFGVLIPPPAFIALEPIFIVILGPLLAMLWKNLHMKKRDLSLGMKFALSFLLLTVGMAVLLVAIHFQQAHGFIAAKWIILFYLSLTLAEMLLSPIGLSMITELSPPHLTGMMMGVWFMAIGYGGELSGYLETYASIPKNLTTNLTATNIIYSQAFLKNLILSSIVCIALFALTPWLKRLVRR